ncbi:uncharacterized protein PFLUO_LOCUS4592 [Penicillium psychrofluorescens]|uniref:uncharacterized protein n=1 Tax=Penicillium psychrofluorescens TaxID=3158075 RepID=UPI003CCDD67C
MVEKASVSLSPRSVARPIHAVPYADTITVDAPATRSLSLPRPADDAPAGPDGRSLSTSAASTSPSPVRSALKNAGQDSGLMPCTPTGENSRSRRSEDNRSALGVPSPSPSLHSVPSIVVNDTGSRPSSRPGSRWSERKWSALRKRSQEFDAKTSSEPPPPPVPQIESAFSGISLDIPTGKLDDLGTQTLKFSNSGSLLVKDRSKRPRPKQLDRQSALRQECEMTPASSIASSVNEDGDGAPKVTPRPPRPQSLLRPRQTSLQCRAVSADEDMLSRRVRLMYEKGEDNVTDSEVAQAMAMDNGVLWEEGAAESSAKMNGDQTRPSTDTERIRRTKREEEELSGGIEDWKNVGAADVDRYGFIRVPTTTSTNPSRSEPNPLQRVTTSLLLASETPRRKHSLRPGSGNRSLLSRSPSRKLSQSSLSNRPSSSQSTQSAPIRRSTSRLRTAANHLPHNRDRKVKDEAGDMLTLPYEVPENEAEDSPMSRTVRKKEWDREDKWTKMAKPTKKRRDGGGMTFEFDTQSSKVIERTWKGIPDRWRSTAWYSFLEASAKRRKDSPSERDLIDAFHEYQYVSSPDDVQIDIDVPRTITSHIMFRRRYRGGQRLLFRVLHAMSLYFPDTGYVQGMAALAATLLAYYDEEHAFVMLARLWQLRGLEQLYKEGFAGLMEALSDFEREWLAGGEVATKLNEVGVLPTAYGTRWYLTLFNYSIPFPAQLRVWDVFMLLGDAEDTTGTPSGKKKETSSTPSASSFGQGLDVLHATSAALIDGMREIILESDFENAMKVLTSWVPIKDVELFMRVAKAEWKVHRRKKSPHP